VRHRLVERGDLAGISAIQVTSRLSWLRVTSSDPAPRAAPHGRSRAGRGRWRCRRCLHRRWPLSRCAPLLRQRLRPAFKEASREARDSRTRQVHHVASGRQLVDRRARTPARETATTFTSRHAQLGETAPGPLLGQEGSTSSRCPLASAQSLTPWSGSRWRHLVDGQVTVAPSAAEALVISAGGCRFGPPPGRSVVLRAIRTVRMCVVPARAAASASAPCARPLEVVTSKAGPNIAGP